MPIPLAIELAKEKFPNIVNTKAEAKDIKPVDIATSNKITKKYNDNKSRKTNKGNS
jgi:hypothetical protein